MNNTPSAITHDLRDVLSRAADPAAFIAAEEAQYHAQIDAAARRIADGLCGCLPVLQCGPSSVGKTTTAALLCRALEARGVEAHVVSLDDFYRGVRRAPLLENGKYDYESPLALDLDRFHECVAELIQTGKTHLPRYDFPAGKPAQETRLLQTGGHAAVIFEGIQAFSPLLRDPLTAHGCTPVTVFVNTRSRFTDGDSVLLCRRDIRLCRRLLRDERTRASSFTNTMDMWAQVIAGEERYIFPYQDEADVTIDTTMGYEPCLLSPLLGERLVSLYGTPYEETARRLKAVYERFPAIDTTLLPANALLREFVG